MNCNCCNCSNNNAMSCEDEKHSKIKIYGTLVNATLDTTLDDANCAADNQDYDTGHNDALAYAYQLHDGRFRADDKDLPAHRRFQDDINRRITNIDYDPENNETLIFNKETNEWEVLKACDCESYDDAWLKAVIGATPNNHESREGELNAVDLYPNGGDTPVHKNNIIDFILNLAAEVNNLRARVIELENGGGSGTCYWKVDSDNYLSPNNAAIGATCQGVRGPGFYDTSVSNP